MARTRWPPGPVNPGLLPRPGRSDRQRRWVPENLGPGRQIVSQDSPSGVSRIGGQAGTQAPDPTPVLSQDRGSRAGSTIHSLPVDSAAQARQVAGAVRYPPAGYRSAGGVLAAEDPFCLVMAESAGAVADLDAALAVDGVDGLYVGPGDLSLSLGCEPGPDDPVLNRALQRVWAACAAAGKLVGVHATDGAVARRYRDAGCTLITTAVDATAITRDTAAQFSLARA